MVCQLFGFYTWIFLIFEFRMTVEFGLKRHPIDVVINTTIPTTTTEINDGAQHDLDEASQNQAGSNSSSSLSHIVGGGVQAQPYDSSFYRGSNGGPIKTGDDLECKGGQICCWANGDASNVNTLKWQAGNGPVDMAKLQTNFDSDKPPDEHYLIVYSDDKRAPRERALFESCSINCANENIMVEFRYWTSPGLSLQVCTSDAFFGDTQSLSNCHAVQTFTRQSGRAKLSLPGGSLVTLKLVVSSFTEEGGSVAIIDHLNVTFKPCQTGLNNTGTSNIKNNLNQAVPSPSDSANVVPALPDIAAGPNPQSPASTRPPNDDQTTNCPKLRCRFEDTTCAYKMYGQMPLNKGFAVRHGWYQNLMTGVAEPDGHGPYVAAYLFSHESTGLRSDQLKITEPRVLRFRCFLGAIGLRLKVCLDNDSNCPFVSKNTDPSDRRRWIPYDVLLPKGTNQVFFIAENSGANQGGIGLDEIELLLPTVGSPLLNPIKVQGSACFFV